MFHTAVVDAVKKRMVVFGGMCLNTVLGDLWVFSFERLKWKQIPAPVEVETERSVKATELIKYDVGRWPRPRYGHTSIITSPGVMYVYGGRDQYNALGEFYAFTFHDYKWQMILLGSPFDTTKARYSHALAGAQDMLFLYGGRLDHGALFDQLWLLRPVKTSSKLLPTIHQLSLLAYDNKDSASQTEQQQMRVSLDAIMSDEVLLMIIMHLSTIELCQASAVSRRWSYVCNDNRLWEQRWKHHNSGKRTNKLTNDAQWKLRLAKTAERKRAAQLTSITFAASCRERNLLENNWRIEYEQYKQERSVCKSPTVKTKQQIALLDTNRTLRIVVVGGTGVGKTKLLERFLACHRLSDFGSNPAIMHDGCITTKGVYNLPLWICEAQYESEAFWDMLQPQDLFLLCFSLVDRNSFEQIRSRYWSEIVQHCPKAAFLLVGTKSDLLFQPTEKKQSMEGEEEEEKRTSGSPIRYTEATALAVEIKAQGYLPCSAEQDRGVDVLFYEATILAEEWLSLKQRECILS